MAGIGELCAGCRKPMAEGHAACVCPDCGGPKRSRSMRCWGCAHVGRPRKDFASHPSLVLLPPMVRVDVWARSCMQCGREDYLEVPEGMSAVRTPTCGICGGFVLSELLESNRRVEPISHSAELAA